MSWTLEEPSLGLQLDFVWNTCCDENEVGMLWENDSLDDMKKYMGTVHLHHFDSGCRKCRNASFKGKHSNLIINIKS